MNAYKRYLIRNMVNYPRVMWVEYLCWMVNRDLMERNGMAFDMFGGEGVSPESMGRVVRGLVVEWMSGMVLVSN